MAVGLGDKERLLCSMALLAYSGSLDQEASREQLSLGLTQLGQELVWGPAFHAGPGELVDDAMMYIAKSCQSEEYTVVVRGTNPLSLHSWIDQDLKVAPPLTDWASILRGNPKPSTDPKVPSVSQGACLTLSLCTALTPKAGYQGEGLGFAAFLASRLSPSAQLNFTGHSLGGLAAPTLAIWFLQKYPEYLDSSKKVFVCPFAGPTAGNAAFADLSQQILDPGNKGRCICHNNALDVVPRAFAELEVVRTIFEPDLKTPFLFQDLITMLEKSVTSKYCDLYDISKDVPSVYKGFKTTSGFADFFLELCWQHSVPYFEASLLPAERQEALLAKLSDSMLSQAEAAWAKVPEARQSRGLIQSGFKAALEVRTAAAAK